MQSIPKPVNIASREFFCLEPEMWTSAFGRFGIAALPLWLLLVAACSASTVGMAVPDVLTGLVEDRDTGVRLQNVEIELDITERNFVAFIGPEGTTKPKIRKSVGVRTDAHGLFTIDLRGVKANLRVAYPSEKLVMHNLHLYKMGYLNLHEDYFQPGQTFRLTKKSAN